MTWAIANVSQCHRHLMEIARDMIMVMPQPPPSYLQTGKGSDQEETVRNSCFFFWFVGQENQSPILKAPPDSDSV